jgi:hypothetical protein
MDAELRTLAQSWGSELASLLRRRNRRHRARLRARRPLHSAGKFAAAIFESVLAVFASRRSKLLGMRMHALQDFFANSWIILCHLQN